jgi:hypothetical protein
VVVGLAARVVQLERLAPDVEVEAGPVRLVGVAVVRRPERLAVRNCRWLMMPLYPAVST